MKESKGNNIFIIVMFLIIVVAVFLFPTIYGLFQKVNLPKVEENKESSAKEEQKTVDKETLDSIHYPIMRTSIYSSNTYYTLDTFDVSKMTNEDIMYNAFMDMYKGNIVNSNYKARCTSNSKEFNSDYITLRIKNILSKNLNYTLTSFDVPNDSSSDYKGNWIYDEKNSRFIYNGLCDSSVSNTKYYDLEEFIKAEYEKSDIIVYYYVGFAKVENNNYTIYKDSQMTQELKSGDFISFEDLNNVFKSLKNKNTYKYIFKDTLCTYNEYCLYEGKWVNGI